MKRFEIPLSQALCQVTGALITVEAATYYQAAALPSSLKAGQQPVDPNSSLANTSHSRDRGKFASTMISAYGNLPGIDPGEFEETVKELLSSLETHESFPKTFSKITKNLSAASQSTARDDKKYQLSIILGSAVAAGIVMVSGLREQAPRLVSRLFSKQNNGNVASKVAEEIDKGSNLDGLDQSLEPMIDKTILRILSCAKVGSDPFMKDGIERFERHLQKKSSKFATGGNEEEEPDDDDPD